MITIDWMRKIRLSQKSEKYLNPNHPGACKGIVLFCFNKNGSSVSEYERSADRIGGMMWRQDLGNDVSSHSQVKIIPFPHWSQRGSQTWQRVPSWVRMNHTNATSITTAACARCALVYLWNCVILREIAKNNFIISLNSKMSCNQFL